MYKWTGASQALYCTLGFHLACTNCAMSCTEGTACTAVGAASSVAELVLTERRAEE